MSEPDLLTPRLQLRLLEAGDADLYRAVYTCPRVMAHIGAPLTPAQAARAFAATVDHNRRTEPGHRAWAVHDRPEGTPVGIGALLRRGSRAEMGLMLLPSAWDGRRSHEVLDALVAHAFGPMGLEMLDAACSEGPNVRPSRRLVRPYGFVEVPADRPGTVQWALHRADWSVRGEVGSAARTE
jgi:RimJ/RimL family protein N-acetyltransferase